MGLLSQALLPGPAESQMPFSRAGGLSPPGQGPVCEPTTFRRQSWALLGPGRCVKNSDMRREKLWPIRTCLQSTTALPWPPCSREQVDSPAQDHMLTHAKGPCPGFGLHNSPCPGPWCWGVRGWGEQEHSPIGSQFGSN